MTVDDAKFYNTKLAPAKFSDKIIAPAAVSMDKKQELGTNTGWKWQRFARAYKAAHPYCCHCGLLGGEIHHILPRATHPALMYHEPNLMNLCRDCHTQHHRKHPVIHDQPSNKQGEYRWK